ncbi:DUF2927 domain-containing protein [Leisingera caerulea]|nr:DUF2927 domain-containing protein [Leisingera caerulea]UWQ50942.1 DUF2927 domain-containing protein [Leisingera caerulea]UWQ84672.1 DUF2927 domain-containing protein [Leisingera caerulea]
MASVRAHNAVWKGGAALAGLAALAACLPFDQPESLVPQPRPAVPEPAVYKPSADSAQLAYYYNALQRDLLTRGLLRTDGGGPDTPYDAEDLAESFEALAFYDEYGGSGISGGLGRWEGPVRIAAEFGPSVPAARRAADTETLNAYAARLARITGHPIGTVAARGNFHVIFASLDDSAFVAERVRELLPAISAKDLSLLAAPPRSFYCLVVAGGPQSNPLSYTRGVALIRAEHPDLVRKSCVHEEVAQGLGLRNDSPRARPSIFNDDDEFALLTSFDEKLLQMLYDPRLKTGMSAEDARPVIRILAREAMGQEL